MRLWAAGSYEDLPHGWVRQDSLVEIGRRADGPRPSHVPGHRFLSGGRHCPLWVAGWLISRTNHVAV